MDRRPDRREHGEDRDVVHFVFDSIEIGRSCAGPPAAFAIHATHRRRPADERRGVGEVGLDEQVDLESEHRARARKRRDADEIANAAGDRNEDRRHHTLPSWRISCSTTSGAHG